MNKPKTIINKQKLFDYLDQYNFVNQTEIIAAICDYIEKQEGIIFFSDCCLAYELSEEYTKEK